MALGLMVLTLVAGCLLWTLPSHFEENYSAAKDGSHPRRARLLFLTLAGMTTVAILVVLLLEFQQLLNS
jgi:hypothetical protein